VRAMLKRREKINRDTDERIIMMQEVLQAIRFVKYYAWEADFLARLSAVRRREIGGIRYLLGHRNTAIAMGSAIPIFSSMLTFITSSLTDHALEPASTFSSLALFNQLRLPLIMFPMVVGLVTDALQSLKRIEQFFLAEDSMEMGHECMDGPALNLLDASFTWEKSTPHNSNKRRRWRSMHTLALGPGAIRARAQLVALDFTPRTTGTGMLLDGRLHGC
jgi:ATP-binding cassette subfamily C (CFTR/MRP) protein 1